MADLMRVLVVDDEEMARRVLAREIRAVHPACTITEASNGEEALERLKAGGFFNIIVSDNSMPGGMRGTDFLREAQTRLPRSVRILVSGDQLDPAEVSAMIGSGLLFAHFTKPWDSAELWAVIFSAVSRVSRVQDQETVRPPADHPTVVYYDDPDHGFPAVESEDWTSDKED